MCGRARCSLDPSAVAKHAKVDEAEWDGRESYSPNENAHPGQDLPVVISLGGERRLATMRWGLIPSFTKPSDRVDFFRMFNARSETLVHKPAFRRLVSARRCVVILSGFYEWKEDGPVTKQPYYVYPSGGGDQPLLLAGLWDEWRGDPGKPPLRSFAICTAAAGKAIEWLHDRMPCILSQDQADRWLDPATSLEDLLAILRTRDASQLGCHKVTKRVNKMTYTAADASRPLDEQKMAKGKISFFFGAPGKKASSAGPAAASPVHGAARKRPRPPPPQQHQQQEGSDRPIRSAAAAAPAPAAAAAGAVNAAASTARVAPAPDAAASGAAPTTETDARNNSDDDEGPGKEADRPLHGGHPRAKRPRG